MPGQQSGERQEEEGDITSFFLFKKKIIIWKQNWRRKKTVACVSTSASTYTCAVQWRSSLSIIWMHAHVWGKKSRKEISNEAVQGNTASNWWACGTTLKPWSWESVNKKTETPEEVTTFFLTLETFPSSRNFSADRARYVHVIFLSSFQIGQPLGAHKKNKQWTLLSSLKESKSRRIFLVSFTRETTENLLEGFCLGISQFLGMIHT